MSLNLQWVLLPMTRPYNLLRLASLYNKTRADVTLGFIAICSDCIVLEHTFAQARPGADCLVPGLVAGHARH